MVEIENLSKRFGPLQVIAGVSLTIRPGLITSIVGPNGTGKSTLLRCLVGLVWPDSGTIRIDGKPVAGDWRYRAQIGYVPQTPRFPEGLSPNELIAFIEGIRGARGGAAARLVEAFGLGAFMARPLRVLSGGTRQKVNLLLAAMFDPDILIMDEPTVGLDPLSSQREKAWLAGEVERGKTVIIASHVMAEVEEISHRVVFLLDGKVYFDGPPHKALQLTEERTLERAIAAMMTAEAEASRLLRKERRACESC